MTQEDIETELNNLRDRAQRQEEREEKRRTNWFANGDAAFICGSLHGLVGVACLLARAMSPSLGVSMTYIGAAFIITALPLNVLSASLRVPASGRR